jgi:hypothetical protein
MPFIFSIYVFSLLITTEHSNQAFTASSVVDRVRDGKHT